MTRDQMTVWDHVAAGDMTQLSHQLDQQQLQLSEMRDESGMTMLHWAADRSDTSYLNYKILLTLINI